jgi:hypothetical protein
VVRSNVYQFRVAQKARSRANNSKFSAELNETAIGNNWNNNGIDDMCNAQSISEAKLSNDGSDTCRNEGPRTDHEPVSMFKQRCECVGFKANISYILRLSVSTSIWRRVIRVRTQLSLPYGESCLSLREDRK